MKISLDDSRVELRARQILRLDDALAVRVTCVRGALWVTQHADARDVILGAGESFTLDRAGVALVSALEPSSVRLDEPTRQGRPRATTAAGRFSMHAGIPAT